MIRFLLNDREVTLADFDPQTTVLDWLRQEQGLCGTKEGCASGDCGACTVVVAEAGQDGLVYQSMNSCIAFLGSLHGRQVITVEHLADDTVLHPVQQAMVDLHGSQCGYCTPGFVMSLFALSKSSEDADSRSPLHRVHDWLGGNLCRCTGYRPIIDAAMTVIQGPAEDRFDRQSMATQEALRSIAAKGSSETGGNRFLIPSSVTELGEALADYPTARLLAGGTDLALDVTQGLRSLEKIILLDRVPEMKTVVTENDALTVGAAVSLTACRDIFAGHYPAIDELLGRFGSRQVRNQGTLGGNIANASPIGDLPPVMLALGADVCLQSRRGSRNMPLDGFFLGYRKTALDSGEFVRSIRIPLPTEGQFFRVYKVSKRLDDDISAVCIAINLMLETSAEQTRVVSARIGVGGMAAIPKRAPGCERELCDKPFIPSVIEAAAKALAEEFEPIDDARASAGYRTRVAQNLLKRCFLEWQGADGPLRVSNVR